MESITDEGLFEQLATAVLREAEPCYRSLVHSGLNAAGKTVKAPIDGITFLAPDHLLLVQHTTSARQDLARKWLNDPTTTGRSRKKSSPAGDLIKARDLAAEQRQRMPNLRTTLVLTTNREPDQGTVRQLNASAAANGITIDLWSRSRLAHFLDHDPRGQWLRRKYLGVEAEQISFELLRALSQTSLALHQPPDRPDAWVSRDLDRVLADAPHRIVNFLVASSGLGKSIACYKLLAKHIADGGVGLVITDETLGTAISIETAIETTLHQLHPGLTPGCGAATMTLCGPDNPLLLVVEDINRTNRASQLVEKIESWNRLGARLGSAAVRIVCPLWPEALIGLSNETRDRVSALSLCGTTMSDLEGLRAVQLRAALIGRTLSDSEAQSISDALGRDPLLIALRDPTGVSTSADVISDFMATALQHIAATQTDYPYSQFRTALRTFATAALLRRRLNPTWSELMTWAELSPTDRQLVNRIARADTVLRLQMERDEQAIHYRHDRVRDWLVSDAAAHLAHRQSLEEDIAADPYYAEVMAGVIATAESCDLVAWLGRLNPLAALLALRRLPLASEQRSWAIAAAQSWVSRPDFGAARDRRLRWAALEILADSEGPEIIALVNRFPEQFHFAWLAKLHNGDLSGGIALCAIFEPGVGMPARDRAIAHAKQKYGPALIASLRDHLTQPDMTTDSRVGALRLAGHLADATLADSIAACWTQDPNRPAHLDDYLWAAAQCCGREPQRYLAPICDAWVASPDEAPDSSSLSPRKRVGHDHLRWAFRKWPPRDGLSYLLARGRSDDALHNAILLLVQQCDTPEALQFEIDHVAEVRRRIAGTGSVFFYLHTLVLGWQQQEERNGVGMSDMSRSFLLGIWRGDDAEHYCRDTAFQLWAATRRPNDLAILRAPCQPLDLHNSILRERLLRKDGTATAELIAQIRQAVHPDYWWQFALHVWSPALTELLDEVLAGQQTQLAASPGARTDGDYTYSDVLMRLSVEIAEPLLVKHWPHLQRSAHFIQAAFYQATPQLIALAEAALTHLSSPQDVFRHLSTRMGLWLQGHPGITRPEQRDVLLRHLALMDDGGLRALWNLCNQRGWLSERIQWLDPEMRRRNGPILYVDEDSTLASLDRMANENRPHLIDHWLEYFEQSGKSRAAILDLVRRWCANRESAAALALLSRTLMTLGGRADLALLDGEIDGDPDEIAVLRADAQFVVRRRTLA